MVGQLGMVHPPIAFGMEMQLLLRRNLSRCSGPPEDRYNTDKYWTAMGEEMKVPRARGWAGTAYIYEVSCWTVPFLYRQLDGARDVIVHHSLHAV